MNKKILSLSALAILGASSLFSATLGAAQMTVDTGMTTFGDVMGPVDSDTGRVYGTYEDEDLNEFFAGEDIADVPYLQASDLMRGNLPTYITTSVSIPLDGVKSAYWGQENSQAVGFVQNIDPSGAYARYDIRMVDEDTGQQLRNKTITLDEEQYTTVNYSSSSIIGDSMRIGARVLDIQGTKTTIRTDLGYQW